MVIEKQQPRITKEWLFSHIDSYQVFHHYVPNLKIKQTISSPIRVDKTPSWRAFPCDGVLLWKDFTTEETGDCVMLVMAMHPGITYNQALEKIANDLGVRVGQSAGTRVIGDHKRVEEQCKPSLIQVTARKVYTKADKEWWGQYMITPEDLENNGIKSITELWINRQKYHIDKNERVYAYMFPDEKYKIYMPERTKDQGRWLSNISQKYINGFSELNGDPKVLITKSLKDKILLSKIVPYPVLSVQNESGSGFTKEVVEKLSTKEVIVNYDADDPGVTNCKKLCDKYGYQWLNTPRHLLKDKIKDYTDWVKATGDTKEVEKHLKDKGIIQ